MTKESTTPSSSYAPALGFDFLTPFVDLWTRVVLPQADTIRQRLIDQADIRAGMDVMDLGCGSGEFLLMVQRTCPAARLIGLEVDPKILEMAKGKFTDATSIEWLCGPIEEVGVPGSLDRVFACLILHHLTTPQKRSTLVGLRRALRPGGELHVADFGQPHNLLMRIASLPLLRAERTAGNRSGRLLSLMRETGFSKVQVTGNVPSLFGTMSFIRAVA